MPDLLWCAVWCGIGCALSGCCGNVPGIGRVGPPETAKANSGGTYLKAISQDFAIDPTKLHDSRVQSAQTAQSTLAPYTLRESNARYVFTTDATTIDIYAMQDTTSVPGGFNSIGLYVNGVAQGSGMQLGATMGVETKQTFAISGGGSHTIEIVDGPAYARAGIPTPNTGGTPVRAFSLPQGATFNLTSPSAPSKRIVVVSDSILSGASVASGSGVYQGPAMLMRANALASVSGAFAGAHLINASAAGRQLRDLANTGPLVTSTVASLVAQCDGTVANLIVIMLGTNDYAANVSAATYQTQLASLVDAIHTALPSVSVLLYAPIARVAPAIETANGAGSTLDDFRTAMSTVQSTRSAYCSFRNGKTAVTSSNMATDGVHPLAAGMIEIEADQRIAVGY